MWYRTNPLCFQILYVKLMRGTSFPASKTGETAKNITGIILLFQIVTMLGEEVKLEPEVLPHGIQRKYDGPDIQKALDSQPNLKVKRNI